MADALWDGNGPLAGDFGRAARAQLRVRPFAALVVLLSGQDRAAMSQRGERRLIAAIVTPSAGEALPAQPLQTHLGFELSNVVLPRRLHSGQFLRSE